MTIDRDHLPDDPVVLRRMVGELLDQLDTKERKLQRVQHRLTQLLRERYGPRSERSRDENQLFMFAAAAVEAGQDVALAKKDGAKGRAVGRRGRHGRQRLPEHLERRRVVHDLPEDQRQCPHCQAALHLIGEDEAERLEYVPASLHVIHEVVRKYACSQGCTVVTATKPMQPIEKGLPGPGLLAQVAVNKYGAHLPLHRQEWLFEREGVTLSRKTMSDWMRRSADLAKPLVELMTRKVLSSKGVQTDDTPVAVLDPTLPRTRTGRIWTYVGDELHPYTVYDYTPTRAGSGPDEFLKEFSGYLQADAYPGYDRIYKDPRRGVVEVGCWAHARRRFWEAQTSDPMRSMVMLSYIRLLYEVEREARDQKLDGPGRRLLRRKRSVPILKDIRRYLKRELPNVLPKSPEGQAISYALSNWKALMRYCADGDLEIDNNGAERSLRGVAIGRRNWTFFGSDRGGKTAAILMSLITTCKRHRIDPFLYLRDVFARISAHPVQKLDELLPDIWKLNQPPQS
jgi:transposase